MRSKFNFPATGAHRPIILSTLLQTQVGLDAAEMPDALEMQDTLEVLGHWPVSAVDVAAWLDAMLEAPNTCKVAHYYVDERPSHLTLLVRALLANTVWMCATKVFAASGDGDAFATRCRDMYRRALRPDDCPFVNAIAIARDGSFALLLFHCDQPAFAPRHLRYDFSAVSSHAPPPLDLFAYAARRHAAMLLAPPPGVQVGEDFVTCAH